jgi:hypothetical protein
VVGTTMSYSWGTRRSFVEWWWESSSLRNLLICVRQLTHFIITALQSVSFSCKGYRREVKIKSRHWAGLLFYALDKGQISRGDEIKWRPQWQNRSLCLPFRTCEEATWKFNQPNQGACRWW